MALFVTRNRRFPCASGLAADFASSLQVSSFCLRLHVNCKDLSVRLTIYCWRWIFVYNEKLGVVRQCATFRSWVWSDNVPLSEAECGQCATSRAECGQTMCHFQSWVWSDIVPLPELSVVRQCATSRAECGQTMCHFQSWVWSDIMPLPELSVVRQCATSRAECGQTLCHFQSWVWSDKVSLAYFFINFKARCNRLTIWFTIQNLFVLCYDSLNTQLWYTT